VSIGATAWGGIREEFFNGESNLENPDTADINRNGKVEGAEQKFIYERIASTRISSY